MQILEPPIVYKPTPKYILELSTKSSTTTSNSLLDEKQQQRPSNLPVAKKPKLEYIPKLLHTTNDIKTPIYKPSPSVNSLNSIEYDIIEEDLSNYTTENINQKPIYIPTKIVKDSDKIKTDEIIKNTDENISVDKSKINEETEKKNNNKNNKCDIEENSSKDKEKHKSNNSSSSNSINNLSKSSHSHSSKRRHKSSSSSSSHYSSRTNKDSKLTSSSSSKHKSSSSSRHSKRSRNDNDHSSSKSSHRSSKSKSSSSSNSTKHNSTRSTTHHKDIKDKSTKDVPRDKLKKNELQDHVNIFNNELIPSPSSLFDTEDEDDNDEDEILKECKMIFNEYESNTTTTTVNIEQVIDGKCFIFI